MYYLQSRYYNPEWGRFINADGIVGQTGELLSFNMFTYCENNVVNMHDEAGFRPVFDSDEQEEEYNEYKKNARDRQSDKNPLQDRDSKKKERRDIDKAFGKRGDKGREEKSNELHDMKNKEGSPNWNNRSWNGLVNGNYEKSIVSTNTKTLVCVGIITWHVIKWGGAIALAPETGGASIVGAALTP